jgi:hypothetical protein
MPGLDPVSIIRIEKKNAVNPHGTVVCNGRGDRT